jgi:hypothetical protein
VIGIKFRAVTEVVGRHGAHVGIGLSEARGSGIHNTLLLIVLVSTSDSMFWEDSWLVMSYTENSIRCYTIIVCYKSNIIKKVMTTSPPDITFMRDLIRQSLVAWNALPQHLATVQLSSETDEF